MLYVFKLIIDLRNASLPIPSMRLIFMRAEEYVNVWLLISNNANPIWVSKQKYEMKIKSVI